MDLALLSKVFGGIGLFMMGMILTTEGLRSASGDALQRILLRFTGGPFKALVSGAVATALVQSSSATTLATIGFVSAGLLTFHQSLGLMLGANLGTTATGWIVAAIGLKFSVSTLALPMVGVGAMLRLFARGRGAHIGMAIAGFGILFVGLDVLQSGMGSVSQHLTPDSLPKDTWFGRVLLVGIGAFLTAIMQSSSAAIATTLTALHTGAISTMQAAAMAIGVNVGTTVTAALGSIGAGTAARRTAMAHLFFNVITGLIAFITLPLLMAFVEWISGSIEPSDPATLLAAFHTTFNLIGVIIFFPFLKQFSAFIERIVPERGPSLAKNLDPALAHDGSLAIEAVRATALEMSKQLIATTQHILTSHQLSEQDHSQVEEVAHALAATHAFIASVRDLKHVGEVTQGRHVQIIHALDHLESLVELFQRDATHIASKAPERLDELRTAVIATVTLLHDWLHNPQSSVAPQLEQRSKAIATLRRTHRTQLLSDIANGDIQPADANRLIDIARALDQLAYFSWRLGDHLSGERAASPH